MMDYSGTTRVDYEDILRAVGYFIDQNNLKEVCIIELNEGVLVRGIRYTADPKAGYQTISESFLFTNEDLEKLLEDAYKRRQPGKGGIFRLRPVRENE
ncbi:MAG TPA: hypothetical protein VEY08_09685 [Chloroflexia bacterium]|nr:hypothetical protein [Chloroflexia bacterium]